jgi:hypothetical protein
MTTNTGPTPDPQPTPDNPSPGGTPRRKRGAPLGNKNARKRPAADDASFYLAALPKPFPQEQRKAFQALLSRKDLTPEITLLRMTIMGLLGGGAASPAQVIQATRVLTAMMRLQRGARPSAPRLTGARRTLTVLAQKNISVLQVLQELRDQLPEIADTKEDK